jgi:hypothetical protein
VNDFASLTPSEQLAVVFILRVLLHSHSVQVGLTARLPPVGCCATVRIILESYDSRLGQSRGLTRLCAELLTLTGHFLWILNIRRSHGQCNRLAAAFSHLAGDVQNPFQSTFRDSLITAFDTRFPRFAW